MGGSNTRLFSCFQTARRVRASQWKLQLQIAELLKEQGNPNGAIAAYLRAAAVQADVSRSSGCCGRYSIGARGLLASVITYRRVVELASEAATARYRLGLAFKGRGKSSRGVRCLEDALELYGEQGDLEGMENPRSLLDEIMPPRPKRRNRAS